MNFFFYNSRHCCISTLLLLTCSFVHIFQGLSMKIYFTLVHFNYATWLRERHKSFYDCQIWASYKSITQFCCHPFFLCPSVHSHYSSSQIHFRVKIQRCSHFPGYKHFLKSFIPWSIMILIHYLSSCPLQVKTFIWWDIQEFFPFSPLWYKYQDMITNTHVYTAFSTISNDRQTPVSYTTPLHAAYLCSNWLWGTYNT